MTRFSTKVKSILQSENQQLLRGLIIINYIICSQFCNLKLELKYEN